MIYWIATIFFLFIIGCLCLLVHWEYKRKRAAKSQ